MKFLRRKNIVCIQYAIFMLSIFFVSTGLKSLSQSSLSLAQVSILSQYIIVHCNERYILLGIC